MLPQKGDSDWAKVRKNNGTSESATKYSPKNFLISKRTRIFAPEFKSRCSLQTSGEVLEWLKRHAWKACIRQKRIGGSNPPLSAILGFSKFTCLKPFFVIYQFVMN